MVRHGSPYLERVMLGTYTPPATAQLPVDYHSIPVRIDLHPPERVPALELVNTGEKMLRKASSRASFPNHPKMQKSHQQL